MQSDITTEGNKGGLSVFSYSFERAGRAPVFWGFLLLIPMLLAIGVWATVAPINAAAIAEGEVVLNFNRKSIQHLEGGIVEEILVEEGQEVAAGAPVLVISDTLQRAQVNVLYNRLAHARAHNARLIAERDGRPAPDFSEFAKGIELSESLREEIIRIQKNLFESRRLSIQTKIDLISAKNVQAQKEIEGLQARLVAARKSFAIASEELRAFEHLYDSGAIALTEKRQKEKLVVDLEGQIGAITANIARLEQAILASQIEIIDLKTDRFNAVLDELQKNKQAIQEATYQLATIKDELKRTVIRAPAQGRVMDLRVHTKGAVIGPGGRILDIVPLDDRLIIEARLNPNDIDLVTKGVKAKVLLSAYRAKKVPKLDGEVLTVSADVLTDAATGMRYFLARVVVDDSILADLKNDVSLYPGMPAQVFFLAGERTAFDYLLAPIVDATYRAFREE